MTQNNEFRIYKVEVSKYVRKDGMRLVKSFGCNGKRHVITYDHVCCDEHGYNACVGKSNVKPAKEIGKCGRKSCKNLGFFSL